MRASGVLLRVINPGRARARPRRKDVVLAFRSVSAVVLVCLLTFPARAQDAIDIGTRLEPFWDDYLIDTLDGAALRLHEPQPADVALEFDEPWEGPFSGYVTVLPAYEHYRMYYRGLPEAAADGSAAEVTCYAESADGITWYKPHLGLFEVHGTRNNNVVLADQPPFSHNFSPFDDKKPGDDLDRRYKALAGTRETGLHLFVSPNGIHWTRDGDGPVITEGAFDSQNVAFWSEHERQYVAYFRTWSEGDFAGYRSISRATSEDCINWSDPEPMTFGGTPMEHLYTNQTQPYFLAPHIYIALPMRFVPGRRTLTHHEVEALGLHPGYVGDAADCVFMTSRGGTAYDRTFMEALIPPGTDLGNWASRAGMAARGVIATLGNPDEISMFKQAHYAQPTAHLLRYAMRRDGFASLHAGYEGGEMITKPIIFSGDTLIVNAATSAASHVRVELLDASGQPIEGYTLEDSDPFIGDRVNGEITWNDEADFGELAGQPVRLRIELKDADLYSVQFAD